MFNPSSTLWRVTRLAVAIALLLAAYASGRAVGGCTCLCDTHVWANIYGVGGPNVHVYFKPECTHAYMCYTGGGVLTTPYVPCEWTFTNGYALCDAVSACHLGIDFEADSDMGPWFDIDCYYDCVDIS